jgi:shikimate dehydrogenase
MRAAVFGAGGAAAAAAFALATAGARELVLLNRTRPRAVALARRTHARWPQLPVAVNDWNALARMDLLVNATSVGMSPHPDASPLPEGVAVAHRAIVFDLVYNPPVTRFLQTAQAQGARVIGGLEMLVYQGARAFELWTGERAPVRVMKTAARHALDATESHVSKRA